MLVLTHQHPLRLRSGQGAYLISASGSRPRAPEIVDAGRQLHGIQPVAPVEQAVAGGVIRRAFVVEGDDDRLAQTC